MRRIVDWVEHRTGLETIIRDFLDEDIPGSSGWRQVFGSVALFCFLVQAVTGMLLLFNYAPTPGEAYNSVNRSLYGGPTRSLAKPPGWWV
ncbi:MAG: hypothetical protein NTY38_24460 [Acidobacteria bacterium]|nr:hypothetical protein [Acidobacteriota bacterium]